MLPVMSSRGSPRGSNSNDRSAAAPVTVQRAATVRANGREQPGAITARGVVVPFGEAGLKPLDADGVAAADAATRHAVTTAAVTVGALQGPVQLHAHGGRWGRDGAEPAFEAVAQSLLRGRACRKRECGHGRRKGGDQYLGIHGTTLHAAAGHRAAGNVSSLLLEVPSVWPLMLWSRASSAEMSWKGHQRTSAVISRAIW